MVEPRQQLGDLHIDAPAHGQLTLQERRKPVVPARNATNILMMRWAICAAPSRQLLPQKEGFSVIAPSGRGACSQSDNMRTTRSPYVHNIMPGCQINDLPPEICMQIRPTESILPLAAAPLRQPLTAASEFG